jgi:Ulp1 protease family, C-terminal catalytic domain
MTLICVALRQYLHWQIRKQQPGFTEERILVERLGRILPQQDNVRDCGVFALMYGLYTVLGLTVHFSAWHMSYFRRKLAWDLLSGRIHLPIEPEANDRVLCSTCGEFSACLDGIHPNDALAEGQPGFNSAGELTSALDVLQLDVADLVENVRQDLQLDDYETVPLTEDQRQVVEAEACRATRVRLCTAECPSSTTSSTWVATLSEKIRRFLPLCEKWDQLKNSGKLASLCDDFEECVEECTEGTNYCEDLSKVEWLFNIVSTRFNHHNTLPVPVHQLPEHHQQALQVLQWPPLASHTIQQSPPECGLAPPSRDGHRLG